MAKKKKTKLPYYLSLATTLFALLAVVMIFLPAIATEEDATFLGLKKTYSGLQTAFGYKKTTLGGEVTHWHFSFMSLLTYLLPLAAFVLLAISSFGKKQNKLFVLLATVCLIASAVFFFSTVSFASFNEKITKGSSSIGGDVKELFKLGVGSILGGVLSILGALSAGAALVLKK